MTIDRIGSYQVLSTLGKGAHSTILHIRRKADSKEYALKVVCIDSKEEVKFLDQARHEFKIAQMLNHPSLIKIYSLELKRNWLFQIKKVEMLIEYVAGKTLDQIPPLPVAKQIPVFVQVASGLVHMHRRGVFHADLKPNNIMLNKRNEAKILDYGLAGIKGETKDRVQGTPEYMAPETVKSRTINEQTDIFNFGATMYRLITLKLPLSAMAMTESGNLSAKNWKAMLKPVRDLNQTCPESLAQLIHQCLEYDANKRPERMSDVKDTLTQIAEECGIEVDEQT